jgi:N-acetylmuramoyl-L-alanine amidase
MLPLAMAHVPPALIQSALTPVRRPLLVVDPGHGGKDPGAGVAGVTEDAVTLDTGRRLARGLRDAGYRVLLTRRQGCSPWMLASAGDRGCRLTVHERAALAVRHRASLFVSLHCDRFGDSSVHGPRTYYFPESPEGRRLADRIQERLQAFRDRPLAPIPQTYYVLRSLPDVPAALVELGFLSSPEDRRHLLDPAYRQRLADALRKGILGYLATTAAVPEGSAHPFASSGGTAARGGG